MMSFPSLEEIEHYFAGSWRMMTGRKDGVDRLDISVDGFWRSFHGITVSLPALLVSWVAFARDLPESYDDEGFRFGAVVSAGIADILAWIAPIVVLALIARRLGLSRRFSVYVIASNWGGALLTWIALPPNLLRLVWPDGRDVALAASVIIFGAELVLSYRLAQLAWQRPPAIALPLFIGLTACSMAVTVLFQVLLGIGP